MRVIVLCLLGTALVSGCSGSRDLPNPLSESERPLSRAFTTSASFDVKSRDCLADAIYHEAKNTGAVGLQAVGHVVMNRVRDREFPNTVCGVVRQGENSGRCQFSFRCDGIAETYPDRPAHRRALSLAERFLTAPPADITKGARFFHASWARPNAFFKSRPLVGRYGGNTFYL